MNQVVSTCDISCVRISISCSSSTSSNTSGRVLCLSCSSHNSCTDYTWEKAHYVMMTSYQKVLLKISLTSFLNMCHLVLNLVKVVSPVHEINVSVYVISCLTHISHDSMHDIGTDVLGIYMYMYMCGVCGSVLCDLPFWSHYQSHLRYVSTVSRRNQSHSIRARPLS